MPAVLDLLAESTRFQQFLLSCLLYPLLVWVLCWFLSNIVQRQGTAARPRSSSTTATRTRTRPAIVEAAWSRRTSTRGRFGSRLEGRGEENEDFLAPSRMARAFGSHRQVASNRVRMRLTRSNSLDMNQLNQAEEEEEDDDYETSAAARRRSVMLPLRRSLSFDALRLDSAPWNIHNNNNNNNNLDDDDDSNSPFRSTNHGRRSHQHHHHHHHHNYFSNSWRRRQNDEFRSYIRSYQASHREHMLFLNMMEEDFLRAERDLHRRRQWLRMQPPPAIRHPPPPIAAARNNQNNNHNNPFAVAVAAGGGLPFNNNDNHGPRRRRPIPNPPPGPPRPRPAAVPLPANNPFEEVAVPAGPRHHRHHHHRHNNNNNNNNMRHHHFAHMARERRMAQEFYRLNMMMAQERELFAAPLVPMVRRMAGEVPSYMDRQLQPILDNDPQCTTFSTEVKTNKDVKKLGAALQQNAVVQTLHLYPATWTDLGVVKRFAKVVAAHPSLQEVHLHERTHGENSRHFVAQLAMDILVKAMASNPNITRWTLQGSGLATEPICHCIATCPHLQQLELIGCARALERRKAICEAVASAQPSLHSLRLVRCDTQAELLFEKCYRKGTCPLKSISMEHLSPDLKNLIKLLTSPSCQVKTLVFSHVGHFLSHHMIALTKGVSANQSVKHVSFLDCSFHPEVVRPLQDMAKNRLDLESFQVTRCNADPSMAILTCFQNSNSHCKSLTMGASLGIEDRLGGDAIRYVLRCNKNLKSLSITGNHRLGDTGIRHLARGLGRNSTLTHLDLSHCSLQTQQLSTILEGIKSNPDSKLESLNLSNNGLRLEGVNNIISDWLSQPNCVCKKLVLNRCGFDMENNAFLALLRAASNQNSTLEELECMEIHRLSLIKLQEVAEALFRMPNLKVLKASCYRTPAPPPVRPAAGAANPAAPLNDDNDDDDEDDDDESDDEGDPMIVEHFMNMANNNANNNNAIRGPAVESPGAFKLLRETFLAGLIHNKTLEHISMTNLLECVMKPKDAARVHAWMDFCGKRNRMHQRLQGADLPLLDILLDIVKDCRDPRKQELTPTGLSLNFFVLRNRPDGLDKVQQLLTQEAQRKQQEALETELALSSSDMDVEEVPELSVETEAVGAEETEV